MATIVGLSAALIPVITLGFTPQKWSPTIEAQNFSKVEERQTIYNTPSYQVLLRTVSVENSVAALAEQVNDPGREFQDHVCTRGDDGCAGDARLYGWETNGYGIVRPVYYTARSGATISGHVWATRSGPAERPGVVITNGSVQADEQLYWFAAQALAKAGYVVLTFDPQGQGQSDTPGEGADQQEGVPAQSDGRPFFIPNVAFGASLRGADMIAWYTTAWLDKYVKGDPTADARLMTIRWRSDPAEAAIDINHDGNMFSFFYQSRLRFHRSDGGAVFDCEDLRPGCDALPSHDGAAREYTYVTR